MIYFSANQQSRITTTQFKKYIISFSEVCSSKLSLSKGGCCSVAQSSLTLCDPLDGSTQASLSFTIFRSLLRPMSIESLMPPYHLLCHPLLLISIFPSIRVFSNELALCLRWPKYWSFSLSIGPFNGYAGLIPCRIDWLQSKGLSRVFSNTTVQKHQFFGAQPFLWSKSLIHT